jgi:hypothetical protein
MVGVGAGGMMYLMVVDNDPEPYSGGRLIVLKYGSVMRRGTPVFRF